MKNIWINRYLGISLLVLVLSVIVVSVYTDIYESIFFNFIILAGIVYMPGDD